jgi:hypothetical protein
MLSLPAVMQPAPSGEDDRDQPRRTSVAAPASTRDHTLGLPLADCPSLPHPMAIGNGCVTVILGPQQEIRAVGADGLGASRQHHRRWLVRSRRLLQTINHALEGRCSPSTRPARGVRGPPGRARRRLSLIRPEGSLASSHALDTQAVAMIRAAERDGAPHHAIVVDLAQETACNPTSCPG